MRVCSVHTGSSTTRIYHIPMNAGLYGTRAEDLSRSGGEREHVGRTSGGF